MTPLIGPILEIGSKLIEKLIPDPQAKAKAAQDLLALQQSGQLRELEISMSAILAEAQSGDPWTSRARPSFLYVIYLVILTAIPMGIVTAVSPDTAAAVATGFGQWLGAIPEEMWWLFGAGYLGYSGARSYDKKRVVK